MKRLCNGTRTGRAVMGAMLVIGVVASGISRAQAPVGADTPSTASTGGSSTSSASKPPGDDFPSVEKVTEGYEKVVSTADEKPSLYTLWVRKKDGQILAELPKEYAQQKHFIALTISSGEQFAGLQAGDLYVYWRAYDKRLALIEPNLETRSTGDRESKASVERLFTDRVLTDVPILTVVPRGGPVIDLDELLVGQASKFFRGVQVSNSRLVKIQMAKAFPENIEVAFEVPTSGGRLQVLHYSISLIPSNPGYTARVADERVGYFTTSYSDLGKFGDGESRVRYVNRWLLEKADSSLKVSPPKEPIVFYLEHTTPIRYRRWVREGVLYWNKAFEKVGIANAIEVYYQDAASGAHMDKDPEDVRYNFIRWLNNDVGTAIGPSRVNPMTGQILDADIVLTDGWIRAFWKQFNQQLPRLAMEGFSPETLAWLDERPQWDPRIRLADPAQRSFLIEQRARRGAQAYGGHPLALADPGLMGDDEYDGLVGRLSQTNGMCLATTGKALDIALMQLQRATADDEPAASGDDDEEKDEEKDEEDKDEEDKDKEELIDGMPETFIGPLLADLVAHEVGHTLGLRHNFKASSLYSLQEINSQELKGKKAFTGSVMDYNPVNINMESGEVQGDYTMIDIGPYDEWAIQYGYTFDKDLKPILARVAEPALAYATDEDTGGPDPLARRYDFAKNPLDYAKNQIRLARYHRERLVEKFVEDGESWAKARKGYEMTLNFQTQCLSMMANWVGGAFVNRDRKGDPNGRAPIEVVPAATQREALGFIIENAFEDKAFGLTPELLERMTDDRWLDGDGFSSEATWPIHDRIMGVQSSVLTMIMNPTTLRRVYDNEFQTPADEEALTLPEVIETVSKAIWKELDTPADGTYTTRKPLITSLRRNLQREHLDRLVDLSLPSGGYGTASKSIANLAVMELEGLKVRIDQVIEKSGGKIDPYTRAHLHQAKGLIERTLNSQMIYNAGSFGGSSGPIQIILGDEVPGAERP